MKVLKIIELYVCLQLLNGMVKSSKWIMKQEENEVIKVSRSMVRKFHLYR